MQKLQMLVPLLTVHLISPLASADDEVAKLRKQLQGKWVPVVVRTDKIDVSAEQIKKSNLTMVIEGKKLYRIQGGERKDEADFVVDAGTSPMRFDTTNKKGVTELGIVAVHGDILLICAARKNNVDRPTEFRIVGEKPHVLTVWKRVTGQ